MKVLFLVHRLPYPPNKGDKIRSFWELRQLSAEHEVDLFCFYDDPADAAYLPELRRYCRSAYAEPIAYLGSRVRALSSLLAGRSFSDGYYYSPAMAATIDRAIAREKYDLAFVFCSSMAQYVRGRVAPAVLDMVDVDSDKWAQYAGQSSWPKSWLWRTEARRLAQLERELVATFDATVVCTPAEAETLAQSVGTESRIRVVRNAIDTAYFDPQAVTCPADVLGMQPYIVLSGQMDYFPNVDAATYFCEHILPLVRCEVRNVRFVIVGRNPAKSVLALAGDGVTVTGEVPDVRPYLKAAAVAVAPLRIARGVQNKVLEAMAMDTPVVATNSVAKALQSSLRNAVAVHDGAADFAAAVVQALRREHDGSLRGALLREQAEDSPEKQLARVLGEVQPRARVAAEEHSFATVQAGDKA